MSIDGIQQIMPPSHLYGGRRITHNWRVLISCEKQFEMYVEIQQRVRG